MKLLLILSLTIVTSAFSADYESCKQAVSTVTKTFGKGLEVDEFSNNSFSDFELTVSEFNNLDNKTQIEIFNKTRDLSHFVISNYSNIMYQIQMFEEDAELVKKYPKALPLLIKLKELIETSCFQK